MGDLKVERLGVRYGDRSAVSVVNDVSFTVPKGGLAVLLGPSGCGKSTILNSVAGLIQPRSGKVLIDGQVVFDAEAGISSPPNKRELGMVFQTYALWPHKTVGENVAYPLRRQGIRGATLKERVGAALAVVRCSELAKRYPAELSGGQQQRVALARALAPQPSLILFDEPLSNLDAELRRELRDELAALHDRIGFTGLYVTHDQAEALSLASQIHVMKSGSIIQSGVSSDVYERPANATVAGFFGANIISGQVDEDGAAVTTAFGTLQLVGTVAMGAVEVSLQPTRVRLDEDISAVATVERATYIGVGYEYVVRVQEEVLRVSAPPGGRVFEPGTRVTISAAPGDVCAFSVADGRDASTVGSEERPVGSLV